MKYRHILIVLSLVAFTSCNRLDVAGMFFSSGTHTEDRVAEWLDWNESHPAVVITNAPDDYTVYVCSDIHLEGNTDRVERFLRAEGSDPQGLFSIVNGDIANESGPRPFRQLDSLIHSSAAADTCFVTIGNHDIYFDCQQYFQQYFHTSTYAVTVQTVGGVRDLFIFLDSGNATHGRRQLRWLRDLLQQRDQYRHVVVNTHTCLFRTSYNYSTTPAANLPEEEYYELVDLMSSHNVSLFLMGHFHHKEEHALGGVPYVMTDNLNDTHDAPSYLVVRCADKISYRYEDLY
ncbi:MAG: metallophosphoesterase [Bacteroidales bacterium]|nr:metallophosphoesterase [Bacteroidales bacterium]